MNHYIYGAGGHGKVVLDAMNLCNLKCAGFIDDQPTNKWAGLPVYKSEKLTYHSNQNIFVHIAIGNGNARERVAKELNEISFLSIFHPSAIISSAAKIEKGSFLAAGAIVGPDVRVGEHCIINHLAVLDHDCIVGDFCHIAPHASLGGNVKVGSGVLIGAGAVVLPGILIGNNAIIGAGAIVTKNVESGSTVIGNPARPSA